jgi:acyl transferase domain-containing protein
MAAVLAPLSDVERALAELGRPLSIAAINAPENVVIAGNRADVEAATALFERDGRRVERLRVSHASIPT